jgi:hypothetical protein
MSDAITAVATPVDITLCIKGKKSVEKTGFLGSWKVREWSDHTKNYLIKTLFALAIGAWILAEVGLFGNAGRLVTKLAYGTAVAGTAVLWMLLYPQQATNFAKEMNPFKSCFV